MKTYDTIVEQSSEQQCSSGYGGIAQLARALGSYPKGRGFKSNFRYHGNYVAMPRPGGQAAKTPPFHGGNTGSIPVRVTKKKSRCESICFFFLYRHAQSRESKKAVLNDSCRNAVCLQNYKTEQKSSYWVQGCPARDDGRASSEATDSRPGHHLKGTQKCVPFLFCSKNGGRPSSI